jgi:hypothetical protein
MISPLFNLAFVLHSISDVAKEIDVTYSELDQSRPAGQSNAPVRSWWKPRSTFTLRARGGMRFCPFGVIQSRTLPLRLFVSSPLAPDAPLVSWSSMWVNKWLWSRRRDNYQLCNGVNLVISALHQTLFQACYRFEKFLKNTVLASFP